MTISLAVEIEIDDETQVDNLREILFDHYFGIGGASGVIITDTEDIIVRAISLQDSVKEKEQ